MLNSIYVCNNIKIFICFINIFMYMTNSKTVKYKNVAIFFERDVQWLPFSLEFCKLNIRDLLFSIKGVSSFEKVFK